MSCWPDRLKGFELEDYLPSYLEGEIQKLMDEHKKPPFALYIWAHGSWESLQDRFAEGGIYIFCKSPKIEAFIECNGLSQNPLVRSSDVIKELFQS